MEALQKQAAQDPSEIEQVQRAMQRIVWRQTYNRLLARCEGNIMRSNRRGRGRDGLTLQTGSWYLQAYVSFAQEDVWP